MSVRAATARNVATSFGSSKVPERSPTIVRPSVDLRACVESAEVPALGTVGPVDDSPSEARSRWPTERTDTESARMSLYAPRCAAMCDRSRHRRASSAAGTTPGVARGSAAMRVADSRRTDPIVHREQDRAALTDNHRDGVHDSRASPADPAWDDGRREQRWLVPIRARPGSSAALICFLDRA
jgi:hypothetical protein